MRPNIGHPDSKATRGNWYPAHRLARKFNLPPIRAALIAELAGFKNEEVLLSLLAASGVGTGGGHDQ